MDQKASLSRKKSIAVNSEPRIAVKGNEEENIVYDKEAALEETVKNLHEQVACLVCECNAKDELMAEHTKATQEAIKGREKAEEEVAIWKQELQVTLQHNIAAYERLVQLNASLKNCKTQLNCLKVEQNERVNLERANKRLELKYTEVRKKLAKLSLENALLTKALVKKEEITVNADVANQEHKESENLEDELKRLRLLVKKRVPGNVKMKPVDKGMSLMVKKLSEMEEENRSLKESLCERDNEIRVLKGEIENLKSMNVDIDYQLCGAKFEIKEGIRKVSVMEMELEDKSQQYERLEATCLELQLQLATVSSNKEVTKDLEQEGKLLHTGFEITKELTSEKKLSQHSSLRDQMAADDGFHSEDIVTSSMIKNIIIDTETKDTCVPYCNTYSSLFGVKSVVSQALPLVPWKKHVKGIELLRKLLFRRKRGGNKKKLRVFSVNHIK